MNYVIQGDRYLDTMVQCTVTNSGENKNELITFYLNIKKFVVMDVDI